MGELNFRSLIYAASSIRKLLESNHRSGTTAIRFASMNFIGIQSVKGRLDYASERT